MSEGRRTGLPRVAVAGAALFGAVVVIGSGLALAPWLLHDRVLAWVDRAVDDAVQADVAIGDARLSMFSAFPRLSVGLQGLSVTNRAPFDGVELFAADEVDLAVDVASLFSDEVRVRRLTLIRPRVHVVTDAEGHSNASLGGGSSGEPGGDAASTTAVQLDALHIEDLALTYDDVAGGKRFAIDALDLDAKVEVSGDRFRTRTTAELAGLDVALGGVTWLDAAQVDADIDLDLDAATGRATFGENHVVLNDLDVSFAGTVWPRETATEVDLAFSTAQTGFASLLSLVPNAYGPAFAKVDAGGTFTLTGSAKGAYAGTEALPSFALEVGVRDGRFRFPDLPTGVNRVTLDLGLAHPGGSLDALVVDVRKLELEAGGAPFSAVAHVVNPLSDPRIDATLRGRLDLAALRGALPADDAGALPPRGRLDLDLAVAGRMSDFTAARTDAVKASGTVHGEDVAYEAEGWPPITVQRVDLALDADAATLSGLALTWDGSDLAADGALTGLVPYALGDGTLGGRLAVRSRRMDLRPFAGDATAASRTAAPKAPSAAPRGKGKGKAGKVPAPAPAPADTSPGGAEPAIVSVPTDLDLRVTLDVGELVTPAMTLADVTGAIGVDGGSVRMEGLSAGLFGGRVTFDGGYAAPTPSRADLDLAVTGVALDLRETVSTFVTVRQLVPLLENATGRYDTGFELTAALGPDGSPELSSLSSRGLFSPATTVVRPAVLRDVGAKLGAADTYDALSLAGAKIAYAFERGRFDLKPFTAKLGPVPVGVSGSAGVLDKSLDLALAAKLSAQLLAKTPLADALGGKGGAVDVIAKIRGTWDAPKVSVALDGADVRDVVEGVVGDVVDGAVDAALQAAREKGDMLVAVAEEEARRLRAQGAAAGEALRTEAKARGQALIEQAKGPIEVAAAKQAAAALATEADKAADKVEAEADKAADAAIAKAKAQRDALLREAEAKAKGKGR